MKNYLNFNEFHKGIKLLSFFKILSDIYQI